MRYVNLLLLLLIPLTVSAKDFDKGQIALVKNIIWAADKSDVPRELLLALCWSESNFRTKGVTHLDGDTLSHGACQVKLETAQFLDRWFKLKMRATVELLENPRINAFYASKLLRYQLNRYDWDWKLSVDAYNKGTAVGTNTEYIRRFMKSYAHVQKHVGCKYGMCEFKPLKEIKNESP